jgi:hypothetical protein
MSQPNRSSLRQFGFVFTALFVVIGLSPWLFHHAPVRVWALVVALMFAATAIVAPRLLTPFDAVWRQIGLLLHHVTNPLFMAIIYWLAFVPLGVAIRLSGKQLLRMKREPEAESYWIVRAQPGISGPSMSRQF